MQGSDASLRERRMRVLRWWWRCKRRTGEWRKERGEEHCERSVHPPPPSLMNGRVPPCPVDKNVLKKRK